MRKLYILLFGFYFVHLDDFQSNSIIGKIIYYLIKILTTLIVSILPYCFVRFTIFRIMVYFVDTYYKYIPIDLDQLIKDADLQNIKWGLHDIYETNQLDQ